MRLFVAVDLDPLAREAVGGVADDLARRFRHEGASPPVRWVAPPQLHFTLRFLGEVTADHTALVRRALRRPWATGAFSASLSGLDVFPRSGAPRVVWLGMGDGQGQMFALKAEADLRLASVGFEPETRPFRAHLTLGRFSRPVHLRQTDLREVVSHCPPATVRWVVDRVVLYESRLAYRGATYHVVESVSLGT